MIAKPEADDPFQNRSAESVRAYRSGGHHFEISSDSPDGGLVLHVRGLGHTPRKSKPFHLQQDKLPMDELGEVKIDRSAERARGNRGSHRSQDGEAEDAAEEVAYVRLALIEIGVACHHVVAAGFVARRMRGGATGL